ncbi:PREDICTED: putative late blight resistance protein homolog R1A-4 [Ipomoea nil]|uniref:putative late blight resistance protein homolog R1A-4 n=1 Tax=Ipomoea nil TaxID=35883 RepID=UPI0009012CE9|nr:PREDICTED: putative late blight resistance protein homolog R1A-4 [Ipomoea nil]
MAYAAVTSLMETLSLHFLQSQPGLPLEDLEAQIRDGNENLGLLQQILERAEIGNDDAGAMKDLEAEMRDVWFKAEERIEMELTTIYLAKDSLLHITACLLRLHKIFIEAEKQTDYHKNELIRIQREYQLAKVSLLGQIRRRGLLQLVKGSLQHDPVHKKIIMSNFSKKASKFDSGMVGCKKQFEKILDQLLTQQTTNRRQVVSIVGMGGIGKTTLAHKLYQDPSVTSHFDKRAWVTVSQEYNMEQMLRCLIGCVIAASRDELHEQSTGQYQFLAERLYRSLKGQRYLIVIDDLWNTTAWDSVQRCFPDDDDNDGSLFEQIGRDIVEKCKGLPLAITIVASLPSKTEEEEKKWKNVVESVVGGKGIFEHREACEFGESGNGMLARSC